MTPSVNDDAQIPLPPNTFATSPRRRSLHLIWVLLAGGVLAFLALWAWPHYRITRIETRLYQDNLQCHVSLPAMPPPRTGDRILIIAPHPDDEVLGFGGYIRQALATGATIHIVTITNGDLRGKLPDLNTKRRGLPASVFIRVGYVRQQESLAALRMLGLPPETETFLGYPNGPIFEMWSPEYWLPSHPVKNNRTHCTASPYTNAFTHGAIYCGQSLTADLEEVMRREAPTILFNLDPNELHEDHIGASVFTAFAFNELRAAGVPFTRQCQVYHYLVHRQFWPAPMAYLPDARLDPPASLYRLFPTQWLSLPLTHEQTLLKHRALEYFVSQGGVESPVLAALPRRNELFRRISDASWPAGTDVPLHPVLYDPPADTDASVLQPDADIEQVLLGRAGDRLLVKVLMRGAVTAHTHCTLCLHGGGATPACRRLLSYSWQGQKADCRDERGLREDTASLTATITDHAMLLSAPWPLVDSGPQRTQFFQIHAFTASGKRLLNMTMSQTVVLSG